MSPVSPAPRIDRIPAPGPGHACRVGRAAWLTLPEQIELEAARYAQMGTSAGELIRRAILELAAEVRATGASTAPEHFERAGLLSDWESERADREAKMRMESVRLSGEPSPQFDRYF